MLTSHDGSARRKFAMKSFVKGAFGENAKQPPKTGAGNVCLVPMRKEAVESQRAKCIFCKKSFAKKRANQIYCHRECREAANKQRSLVTRISREEHRLLKGRRARIRGKNKHDNMLRQGHTRPSLRTLCYRQKNGFFSFEKTPGARPVLQVDPVGIVRRFSLISHVGHGVLQPATADGAGVSSSPALPASGPIVVKCCETSAALKLPANGINLRFPHPVFSFSGRQGRSCRAVPRRKAGPEAGLAF